ncbi:MAG: hypothetical protein J6B43_11825 [Lachnospiraceae bacterium]|nr:hypothetical protein [Lachnospiraceae bacterium]
MIHARKYDGIRIYGNILKTNLRHQYPGPALAALALLVLTRLIFNLNALESTAVAKPLEMLMIWIGPALLVPVFGPEQNPEIRDVVRTRRIDYLQVCVLRIGYSALTVALLAALFTGLMKAGESQVLPYHLWGSICSALLLGAVGMAVAGISGNTAAGFMASMLYYLASYGMKNKLGVFSLFSMTGGRMTGKGWQLLAAVFLTVLTLAVMRHRK